MVIVTAVACKADLLLSHDEDIQKLSEGHIKMASVPDIPEQLHLEV